MGSLVQIVRLSIALARGFLSIAGAGVVISIALTYPNSNSS